MEKSRSKSYWESYYSKHKEPGKPSYFAQFVKPFLQEGKTIVELGCGNGRDSFYFADTNGIKVIAVDQCTNEIKYLNEKKEQRNNIEFMEADFTNLELDQKVDYVYSRFTLHAVNLEGELNTLKWVSNSLNSGGLFFIEVRSIFDDLYGEGQNIGPHEFLTDHYRRFVDINELMKNGIENALKPIYSLQAKGLAPYLTEDPIVIRMVFLKS